MAPKCLLGSECVLAREKAIDKGIQICYDALGRRVTKEGPYKSYKGNFYMFITEEELQERLANPDNLANFFKERRRQNATVTESGAATQVWAAVEPA